MNKESYVTDISEEDFRRLDLYANRLVKENGKMVWKLVSLNEVLDENIDYWKKNNLKPFLDDLKYPITVAIHNNVKENGEDPEDYYLDKFMDSYTGPKTYEIGVGIKHIYITRDYFEDREDYWKVLKRETKALYRVHLANK